MGYHSQNNEAQIVAEYFGDFKGTLLDVGANDGITFSNSFDLITKGWKAVLMEPGEVFNELVKLHRDNELVDLLNYGLGKYREVATFYESGAHVPNGSDKGLVSSTKIEETDKWRKAGVSFQEREIQIDTFEAMHKTSDYAKFHFITIDCEGSDWDVLQQINLQDVDCRCLCIEWNGDPFLFGVYSEYVGRFGMKEIHRNRENLIFAI